MSHSVRRFAADDLRRFYEQALIAAGATPEAAQCTANGILYADIHGIDTHGALGFHRIYLQGLRQGLIDGASEPVVAHDAKAAARIDGKNALGFTAGLLAAEEACRRAGKWGVGAVGVFNSSHAGSMGFYARHIAERGAIGLAFTNLGKQRILRPPSGAEPLVGTNVMAVAAPTEGRPAFCLDMSAAAVSAGRIRVATHRNERVPTGWLADDLGNPVNDPGAWERQEAFLQILGGSGATGGHKGFGLALLVDLLCGLLAGGAIGPEPHAGSGDDPGGREDAGIGHFMLALDVGAFTERSAFSGRITSMLDTITSSRSVDGSSIAYPGLPEHQIAAERRSTGIPVDTWLADSLIEDARQMSVRPPEPFD